MGRRDRRRSMPRSWMRRQLAHGRRLSQEFLLLVLLVFICISWFRPFSLVSFGCINDVFSPPLPRVRRHGPLVHTAPTLHLPAPPPTSVPLSSSFSCCSSPPLLGVAFLRSMASFTAGDLNSNRARADWEDSWSPGSAPHSDRHLIPARAPRARVAQHAAAALCYSRSHRLRL
ncbi:hypothetical protein C8R45DRAFT_563693 [Mycena sanguinolenta]|nr:hypothetical protein C8R45DRAFT_563693 [Mycena sanguinolenta]